jgi:histidine ammonia-lyase
MLQVRLPVLQLLARFLAASAQPPALRAAASDTEVLAELLEALQQPPAAGALEPLSPAEQAVVASGLTPDERSALLAGQPVTAGIGALSVRDGQQLLAAAAAIAALSAEALQAQVRRRRARVRSRSLAPPAACGCAQSVERLPHSHVRV